MKYLFDTCALSEIQKPRPQPSVLSFFETIDDGEIFISVISIGEIAHGIDRLPKGQKKTLLGVYLKTLRQQYANHILPFDVDTAQIWARITAEAKQAGRPIPAIDAQIAACAIQHGLHLVTRNTQHFKDTGVSLIDPWK